MKNNRLKELLLLMGFSEEKNVLEYRGDSIDLALQKAKASHEYKRNYNDAVALQNLEHEAIYEQAYIDCLKLLVQKKQIK